MPDIGGGGGTAGIVYGIWKISAAFAAPFLAAMALAWRAYSSLAARLRVVENSDQHEKRMSAMEAKQDKLKVEVEDLKRDMATREDLETMFNAQDKKIDSVHQDVRELRATQLDERANMRRDK